MLPGFLTKKVTSKTVYNIILFLIFLLGFFVLIRYIRSKEGFANPQVEIYDLHEFFKKYPIGQICPIYDRVFQKAVLAEKLDEQGKPYPDDIAIERARGTVKKDIPIGVLQCPFQLPEKKDLDISLEFVRELDPNILGKAMNTLLYCAVNVKVAIDNTNEAIAKKPVRENFITECSTVEMNAAAVVPLQCIRPELLKGTEKAQIEAEDKVAQQVKQSKKIEITEKLLVIANNYAKYMDEFRKITKREVNNIGERYMKIQASADLYKNMLDKAGSDDERDRLQKTYEKILEEKVQVEKLFKKMTLYDLYSTRPMSELITETIKLEEELKVIEGKMKSGEISF